MNKLFFDIETIPVEKNRHGILREIHQKKLDDGKKVDGDVAKFIEETSFNGAFGRIAGFGIVKIPDPDKIRWGRKKKK